ncbi:DUF6597 domain-containing transcriptional factor [Gordoniibacillus kamchatkensis]|uniref:DUF6597 domain-containing transcriptional factor n=1 Tax=Gordoniibacillus kamchatkensis TaxID=1590651 RepID=UPI000695FF49|nr:DUF6597 domain-containing transcriptional factor [Paenibacillus sp. VKM B-2647]
MDARLHALFRPVQANGREPSNRYVEVAPSPLLKPYVACYWASEPAGRPLGAAGAAIDRVLPDGCTDILFGHDVARDRYSAHCCGIFDRPFAISYDAERPMRKLESVFFPAAHTVCSGCPLRSSRTN